MLTELVEDEYEKIKEFELRVKISRDVQVQVAVEVEAESASALRDKNDWRASWSATTMIAKLSIDVGAHSTQRARLQRRHQTLWQ